MAQIETQQPSILLVDDDATVIQVLSKCLQGAGRVRFATSGSAALRLAHDDAPDLMLLDAEMPGMSGFEVLEAMRADPSLREVPVIFVTSHSDDVREEKCLALGAADFIAKPVRPAVVAARVRTQLRLKAALDHLKKMATTDSLTGCANRRALDDRLAADWNRALRARQPLSIIMLDIDHFKKFNDLYGHLRGDNALIAVAQALRRSACRPGDMVARFGGEEFAVLLPDTDQAGAKVVEALLQTEIEKLGIEHQASAHGRLTASTGIASFDEHSQGWERSADIMQAGDGGLAASPTGARLLTIADRALYASKQAGRARTSLAQIHLSPDQKSDGSPRVL